MTDKLSSVRDSEFQTRFPFIDSNPYQAEALTFDRTAGRKKVRCAVIWCCCIASDLVQTLTMRCGKEIIYFSVELRYVCDAIPLMASGIIVQKWKVHCRAHQWPHLCDHDADVFSTHASLGIVFMFNVALLSSCWAYSLRSSVWMVFLSILIKWTRVSVCA